MTILRTRGMSSPLHEYNESENDGAEDQGWIATAACVAAAEG